MENFSKMKQVLATYEAAQKTFNAAIEEAIEEARVEFFVAAPEVVAIDIALYVPGFNDGDPCLPGLTEPQITLTAEAAKALDLLDQYDEETDDGEPILEGSYALSDNKHLRAQELSKLFDEFTAFMSLEILERLLEYNEKITFTSKGSEITDYDCGY